MATKKPKKERALDLGRLLRAVDTKNYGFYQTLTDDELKEFSPYVLMRFVSNAKHFDRDIREWYIIETNEKVNKHHWALSKNHEGLLWTLFAGVGVGEPMTHTFIPMIKGSLDKFEKLLEQLNPSLKNDEIKLLAKLMDEDDRRKLFDDMGFDKKQRKEYE